MVNNREKCTVIALIVGSMVCSIYITLNLRKKVIYWKFLRAYMIKELWNLEVLASFRYELCVMAKFFKLRIHCEVGAVGSVNNQFQLAQMYIIKKCRYSSKATRSYCAIISSQMYTLFSAVASKYPLFSYCDLEWPQVTTNKHLRLRRLREFLLSE